MDVSIPINLVLTSGLLHGDDVEPIWSGTLIFLKLPMAVSSSCPFDELELVEMLPKEELLWFLFVKLGDELPIGIGTGTYGVAIFHERNLFWAQEFKVHSLHKPCFLLFSRTIPAVKKRKYCCNFKVKPTLRYCFGKICISVEMVLTGTHFHKKFGLI